MWTPYRVSIQVRNAPAKSMDLALCQVRSWFAIRIFTRASKFMPQSSHLEPAAHCNMSGGPPQHLEYSEAFYHDSSDHIEALDLSWISPPTGYPQFANTSAGAVDNISFSNPFNPPYPQYTMNVGPNGLLFAPPPPPQPQAPYFFTSPTPSCVSLPPQGSYSNLNSPWIVANELDDTPQPPVPLPPPEANSGWAKQQRRKQRKQRENLFYNKRYNDACSRVIDIMASVKVQLDSIDTVGGISGNAAETPDVQRAQDELAEFILEQHPVIQKWLNAAANKRVVTDANIKAAVTRRGPVQRVEMYKCFWCKNYMTTKGNLSNHVRSHLGFHISFCNECSFSAVTPRIPTRHTSTHRDFGAIRQRGRGSM
ncbi:hypothetical protein BJ165DRAFT_1155113 [Panaeolus papilionaceus]|nr:hypothetical protein BJ165DRAFT_1155113 [Panaeolus papilionaceus]